MVCDAGLAGSGPSSHGFTCILLYSRPYSGADVGYIFAANVKRRVGSVDEYFSPMHQYAMFVVSKFRADPGVGRVVMRCAVLVTAHDAKRQ